MSINLIPLTPPDDHRWIRQVFCVNTPNRQLVLHDHTRGIHMPVGGVHPIQVAAVPFTDSIANTQDDDLTSPMRMVAHILGAREEVINHLWAAPANNSERQAIILEVSSQEATSSLSAVNGNIVWLSMKSREAYKNVSNWLNQFLDLSFKDARNLAELQSRSQVTGELEYLEEKYSKFLNVILPGSVDAPLALRLLCEAWLYTSGEESKVESSIMIHAPQNLKDWLEPFATDGGTSTKERVIAAMEKSQRVTVLKLFDAVDALESAICEDAKSNAKRDLAKAIEKVMNPTPDN